MLQTTRQATIRQVNLTKTATPDPRVGDAAIQGAAGGLNGEQGDGGRRVEPLRVMRRLWPALGFASHRVISTVDPETRHMHKSRSSYRDGYKAHVAVEPSTGLITACDLTPANEADGPTGIELLADESKGLDVLADSAYGSGDSLAKLDDAEHRILI